MEGTWKRFNKKIDPGSLHLCLVAFQLTLLHSEGPKLYGVLALPSAIGLDSA